MKNALIIVLLFSSLMFAKADNDDLVEYDLLDPRPLQSTSSIAISKENTVLLKKTTNFLTKTDILTIKEVSNIIEKFYLENSPRPNFQVKRMLQNQIKLIRIGELEDNYFKDGIFVYYTNSMVFFDTGTDDDAPLTLEALVTLEGKVISKFIKKTTEAPAIRHSQTHSH